MYTLGNHNKSIRKVQGALYVLKRLRNYSMWMPMRIWMRIRPQCVNLRIRSQKTMAPHHMGCISLRILWRLKVVDTKIKAKFGIFSRAILMCLCEWKKCQARRWTKNKHFSALHGIWRVHLICHVCFSTARLEFTDSL